MYYSIVVQKRTCLAAVMPCHGAACVRITSRFPVEDQFGRSAR